MTWPKCPTIVGTLDTRSMLANPTPEIMALSDEEYQELEEAHGTPVPCNCPLVLPKEVAENECIYCRWERENGRGDW